MFRYILDRIVAMFLTLFIIVSIAFMVVRLMPGSVYEMGGDLSQTVIDALNAKYHFDEPIIKQYGYFLQNIFLHWDWGTSAKMRPNVPVFEILRDRIPITLQINLISLFAALPVGMAAGIIAAIKKNTIIDHLVSLMVVLSQQVCSTSWDLRRVCSRLFTMFPQKVCFGGSLCLCRS